MMTALNAHIDTIHEASVLQAVINAVPTPIFFKDAQGRYLGCNQAFEHFVGRSRDELVGKDVFALWDTDMAQIYHDADAALYDAGGKQEYEAQVVYADGTVHDVVFHKAVFFAEEENVSGIVGAILDITERKRHEAKVLEVVEEKTALNEKLQYEIDLKDRFFSILAHELKTPFNSLLGLTTIMSSIGESMSKEKIIEHAHLVNEASERAFELVQNLLQWARLQMEGRKPQIQSVDVSDVYQECFDTLNAIATEKGITLESDIQDAHVMTDLDMLSTVIRNLIANAIKFSNAGGVIKVQTQRIGNGVQVCVSDSGVGMTPHQVNKVFALDEKTSTQGTLGEKGTGLGLPLCKDMIERNGGQIWVESEVGQGARFYFTLPADRTSEMHKTD